MNRGDDRRMSMRVQRMFEAEENKGKKLTFMETCQNIALMLRYYLKYSPMYFWANVFYTVLVSFVDVMTGTVFLKLLFDALEQQRSLTQIVPILAFNATLIIIRNVFGSYIVEYMEPKARITVSEKMRQELFEKAIKMDLSYYETPDFYTEFVWAASQAETRIMQTVGACMGFIARCSELLFLGGVMVILDPTLLVFAVLSAAVRFVLNNKIIQGIFKVEVEIKPHERRRDYSQRIFYLADYAKELRLSEVHDILYSGFKESSARMQQTYKEKNPKLALLKFLSDFGQETFLTLLMLLYLSYKIVVVGNLSLGDFAALLSATNRFARRMTQFVDVLMRFLECALYTDKFKAFLEYKPSIETHIGSKPLDKAGLELKGVTFKYQGAEKPSLENINMMIHPGEKIAIVGYNGAGKSTLVKLLMRLYDVSEGSISQVSGDDSQDIRNLDVKEYRDRFGVVFQHFQIFAASVGENIAMDFLKEDKEDEAMEAMEKSGFLARFNTLPNGLRSQLTKEYFSDGTNLSGGEAQKVAVARVFFSHFDYIIMDEPSSALDPISEYNLNKNMLELAKDKTVIFISHRLSTTCIADRIFMLENGHIIEEGSHDELMALNGKYAQMFNLQAEKYLKE